MMPRLRVLSVKNNRIMKLSETTFRKLRGNIAVLDVDGNPIYCSCELMWLRVWLEETNSPNPGPKCPDGKFLRNSKIDKDECNNDFNYSNNNLPLMNEHGDIFLRQLTDECDNELIGNYEQKPLPGESEFFYDQYIDFPNNDTYSNITKISLNTNTNKSPFNVPSESSSSSMNTKFNSSLNYNLRNRPHHSHTHANSSPFTFFGYPLPSLNVGNIFSYGRKEGNNINDKRSKASSSPSISTRGKVRMYRPTDSELEKYLNQETQFRDITSRNRAPSSIEMTSQDENQQTFKTSFKTPANVEKGGFLPIIPDRFGGFIPSEDPFGQNYNNKSSLTSVTNVNITNKSDSDNDHVYEDNSTEKVIPIPVVTSSSVSLITSHRRNENNNSSLRSKHVQDSHQFVDIITTTPTVSTQYSSDLEDAQMKRKVTHKLSFINEPFTTTEIPSDTIAAVDITNPSTIITDDDDDDVDDNDDDDKNFLSNSTPETILLIPPENEQRYFNKPDHDYSTGKIDEFNTASTLTGILDSNQQHQQKQYQQNQQQSKYNQRSGRPIITKVLNPHNPNLPTAEEYFRTTAANTNSDNEVQPNELVTTSYYKPHDEIMKKSGMDWYYENYRNTESSIDIISNFDKTSNGIMMKCSLLLIQMAIMILYF